MMIWSEYLKSITRIIQSIETAEKAAKALGSNETNVIYLGTKIPLEDDGGETIGHLIYFEESWWFEPDPEAFKDPRQEGKP